ncbi:UMP kinase [Patescibacteria group bacterium]
MKNKTVVLSLGGSLIIPNDIDVTFLKKFRTLIRDLIKHGYKFVIICGGGEVNRKYVRAANKLNIRSDKSLDWIGIHSTWLNASLLKEFFGADANSSIIYDYSRLTIGKKPITIGGGWRPGCSSDYDAVLAASKLKCHKVINCSDIKYVYTADPDKYPKAKPIKNMQWKEYIKQVGPYKPRGSWPFDPTAARYAKKKRIEVIICRGKNLNNLKKIILEKDKFEGTTIR